MKQRLRMPDAVRALLATVYISVLAHLPVHSAAPTAASIQHDRPLVFHGLLERVKTVTRLGVSLSTLELTRYSHPLELETRKSAITLTTELYSLVAPQIFFIGTPNSGTPQLSRCYAAQVFDRDVACRATQEPCRRPYLWSEPATNNNTSTNTPLIKTFADTGVVSNAYSDTFPQRDQTNLYAKSTNTDVNAFAHDSMFAHLYITSPDQNVLKFIVTLRDPIARAYSEWKASPATQSFDSTIEYEMDKLIECWPELASDAASVLAMPYDAFHVVFRKCATNGIVWNGMYVLFVRNWFELFSRKHFSFTLYEHQARGYEQAPTAVHRVSDFALFAGLHVEDDVVEMLGSIAGPVRPRPSPGETADQARLRVKLENTHVACSFRVPTVGSGVIESAAVKRLRAFVQPYNSALAAVLPELEIRDAWNLEQR